MKLLQFLGRLLGYGTLTFGVATLVSHFVGTAWFATAVNFVLNLFK